ncbi:MAG: AraC family transcriptional regulator [Verrucomicrobiae bacterium]|nr:AraC family transcriptional regulator [Verrucomicrobiae bacterium]
MLFRPVAKPSVPLPMGARSVGHYRVAPGFRDAAAVKPFVQIFWGVEGTGALVLNRREQSLGPGQVAVYFPGMEHRVYALDEPWEYRWWTMDGPMAAALTTSVGLACRIHAVGPAPGGVFARLESAILNVTPTGERLASAMAYELLVRAAGCQTQPVQDEMVRETLAIIHREWRNPLLGVANMAERLRTHRSFLSRRFQAAMGIAPVTYLVQLRVQHALNGLKSGNRAMAEIARDCGWLDPNYFSRCIRQATGKSPREFRKQ